MLEKAQEAPERESIRQSWNAGIGLAASQFFMKCAWALDYWYGGKLILQGQITSKEFFRTIMVLISTGRVIANARSMTTDLAKGSDTVWSVFAILDRETRIEPEDMEAGKSNALVGQSGSGKSTLIGLIERFYDPIRGTVKIDGRDLRSYHLGAFRKHMALVSQEPTLFAGTIRENIVYGISHEMNETEIVEAARAANAHDFIVALMDGYDTWCGEKESRLSTIQACDMIAVLDEGKVVEKGSHSSLLAKGPTGAYYSLVNLQSAPTSSECVE
ncbi:hypothetical protein NL676_014946 [Syzygium grande]|nr:hypothetical protein NL676_014946 [Syzygium grande]